MEDILHSTYTSNVKNEYKSMKLKYEQKNEEKCIQ